MGADPRPRYAAIYEVAARQHGVFTQSQWLAAGHSDSKLMRLTQQGALRRPHPGIYVVAGAPATWPQALASAVYGAGPLAVASHRAATALWKLGDATGRTLDVMAPRHQRVERRGVRMHEAIDLPASDRWMLEAIPVTGIERTIFDAARFKPDPRIEQYVDEAVFRDLTSYEALGEHFVMTARRGKPGTARMRRVLAERPSGLIAPESTFEAMTLKMIEDFGLPTPERQIPLTIDGHQFRIDFGWSTAKVGIECDSTRFHGLQFQVDHHDWRQNLIQLRAGWLLLRYSPRAMRERARYSAIEIADALRERDPELAVPTNLR